MGKYRVAVYAICKNESRFAERWMASMSEADEVYALDTGSGDGTPELLRSLGARVSTAAIVPWRFDDARNASLAQVPEEADICVCTDLDERFLPGWRAALERQWAEGAGRAEYRYTWSFGPDGSEGCVFWISKIHSRRGYLWKGPVHEVLVPLEPEREGPPLRLEGVRLHHHPDPEKSRAQYLPLLRLAVEEDPENDRSMHYLGREYMYRGQWEDCIQTLRRHLSLPSATWADERCASMRYIARACAALGRRREAEQWHLRAVAEAPQLREPWLDYASFACEDREWALLVWLTERALAIDHRPQTYISEAQAWGSLPYDLWALGLYYTGRYGEALAAVDKALELAPGDGRLCRNREYMIAGLGRTRV